MALVGYEWLIVVGVILVVFLWGPQKLPELARAFGLAKKEFEKAAKEASTITAATPTAPGAATPASSGSSVANDEPLIVAAKSLGIITEGKTREEIAKEIAQKASTKQ